MNPETFGMVGVAINIAMAMGLAAYTYLGDRDKVTVGRLDELDKEYAALHERHDVRLRQVEAALGKQPTHQDIAALYDSINTLASTVNQLVGETKMQSDLLRMLINREVTRTDNR